MLKELRNRNEKLLNECDIKDEINMLKLSLIRKILSDDNCFYKMNVEDAYNILQDLGYKKEEFSLIYSKLVNIENYEQE